MTKTRLSSVFVLSILSLTMGLSSAKSAQSLVIYTVSFPHGSPIPWQTEYDGSRYIWYAGSNMGVKGYIVSIDTLNVLNDPATSIQWYAVTPDTNPEGSGYAVSFGVAIGGGYIWSSNQYTGADTMSDLLVRFNPSTHTTMNYWLKAFKDLRAIRYDAGAVWIAGKYTSAQYPNGVGVLGRFNITAETCVLYPVPGGPPYDLLVSGSYVWYTSPGVVGRFNKATNTVDAQYSPSSYPCMLTKDAQGNIWFSMNQAQKIGKIVSGVVTEYALNLGNDEHGFPYDGPYGLVFDNYGKLWIAGHYYQYMMRFDTSSGLILDRLSVPNRPFYPVKDQYGDLWCWGQGSLDMNKISTSIPPIQITVSSSTTGAGFVKVDETDITTPQIYSWIDGSKHVLAANSPVSGGTGVQYVWVSWSDGGDQSHTVTVPSSPATYTANFKKQYLLTISTSPTGGGNLSVNTGWQDDGNTVSVTATANTNYCFYYWSLDGVNEESNPTILVSMNSPHSLIAYFRGTSSISVGLSPASLSLGSTVTLSGNVTPTQPSPGISSGNTVLLSYSLDGTTWNTFIMTQTTGSGAYSALWYPPYPGSYRIKATWNGNSDYQGSTSSTVTLTVTGTLPPRITLLISGPSSVAISGSATFDVLADNPGSTMSTTLCFEVTGPGGYRYSDTQQITLGAGRRMLQFAWQVPLSVSSGQYQVFVSLVPPKPTAIAQTKITVQ